MHSSQPAGSRKRLATAQDAHQNSGPRIDLADRELAATLHALDAPFLHGRVEQLIDIPGRGIDFAGMLTESWSTTERAMIEVACTLWGREDIADARLSPILYSMDDGNFNRVIAAMNIRRGRPTP